MKKWKWWKIMKNKKILRKWKDDNEWKMIMKWQ